MKIKVNFKKKLETTFISLSFNNIVKRIRVKNDDLNFLEKGLYGFILSNFNHKSFLLVKTFNKSKFDIIIN